MLLEFRFDNYRSFRDKQVLTMVANSEKRLLDNLITPSMLRKKKLVRSAVIYGANASGKSNLINALYFVRTFVRRSAESNPDTPIPIQSFWLDKTTLNQPTEFEITFIHNEVRYQYGFVVDKNQVYEEWLLAYPKGVAQNWFERSWVSETNDYTWHFGSFLKGEKNKLTPLTRKNVLFLSLAAQFNHAQLTSVFNWFSKHLRILKAHGDIEVLEFITSQLVTENDRLHSKVKELLAIADLGIVDFSFDEKIFPSQENEILPDNVPDEIRKVLSTLSTLAKNSKRVEVSMKHQIDDNLTTGIPFNIKDESLGTRRLFGISGPILLALQRGEVFAVDELDSSLHPHLVRAIVNLFHNPKTNPHGAQLIFNTHDTTLLDAAIFRRDQIWFTEKDNEGASHLYSLLEFGPRSTEAFGKGYLQGKYGAIPILGSLEGLIANGS